MPRKGELMQFLLDALMDNKYGNLKWFDAVNMKFQLYIMNKRNKNLPKSWNKIYEDWDHIKQRTAGDKIDRFKQALKSAKFLIPCKPESKRNEFLVYQFKYEIIQKVDAYGEEGSLQESDNDAGYLSSHESPGGIETVTSPSSEVVSIGSPQSDAGYYSSTESSFMGSPQSDASCFPSADSPASVSPHEDPPTLAGDMAIASFDDASLENNLDPKFLDFINKNDSNVPLEFLQVVGDDSKSGFLDSLGSESSVSETMDYTTSFALKPADCGPVESITQYENVANIQVPHVCNEINCFDAASFPCDNCRKLAVDRLSLGPLVLLDGTILCVVADDGKKFCVAVRQIQLM